MSNYIGKNSIKNYIAEKDNQKHENHGNIITAIFMLLGLLCIGATTRKSYVPRIILWWVIHFILWSGITASGSEAQGLDAGGDPFLFFWRIWFMYGIGKFIYMLDKWGKEDKIEKEKMEEKYREVKRNFYK